VKALLRALVHSRAVANPELLAAKLRGLTRSAGAEAVDLVDAPLPGDAVAGIDADGRHWVLAEGESASTLGPLLLWLARANAWARSHVLVPATQAPGVAESLAAFRFGPSVWATEGAVATAVTMPALDEATAGVGPPVTFDRHRLFDGLAAPEASAGEELLDRVQHTFPQVAVVPGHGCAVLTVAGLEVARLVVEEGQVMFEVGVGAIDQDARRRVVGHRNVDEATLAADLADLAGAIEVVQAHRVAGGAPHPLRRLRRSRWLLAAVAERPDLAGLSPDLLLEPVADVNVSRSLTEDPPAVAVGAGEVVVCSAGIDLGAVPAAASAWLAAADPGSRPRLTLVVTERDRHPATEDLFALLSDEIPARLVTIPTPW